MLTIEKDESGVLHFSGRFDASQAATASNILDTENDTITLDLAELEYISSMGLGVLMKTFQRLHATGNTIKLRNMNKHISDVFRYTALDKIFEIE